MKLIERGQRSGFAYRDMESTKTAQVPAQGVKALCREILLFFLMTHCLFFLLANENPDETWMRNYPLFIFSKSNKGTTTGWQRYYIKQTSKVVYLFIYLFFAVSTMCCFSKSFNWCKQPLSSSTCCCYYCCSKLVS